jgi:hypothetical protein
VDATLTEKIVKGFRLQAKVCGGNNAPTAAAILAGCADIITAGGPLATVLADWHDHRPEAAVPLRVLGAVHRLVLDGRAPSLAPYFASVGGRFDAERLWPAARMIIDQEAAFIRDYMRNAPQTNECGRSAMMLGGFLAVAAATKLPMRLLEIGASAGLNLVWDQYRLVTPAFTWGPAGDTLELHCRWDGPPPALDAPVRIAGRAACDKDPIDIRDADDRARLQSYIWSDQGHRLERMRRASEIVSAHAFRLDRADAAEWLENELRTLPRGQVTVVFHSVFRQYVSPEIDATLTRVMDEAGRRATAEAPLAHVAMEPQDITSFPDLTLQLWPGGQNRALAQCHYHGEWIKWWG